MVPEKPTEGMPEEARGDSNGKGQVSRDSHYQQEKISGENSKADPVNTVADTEWIRVENKKKSKGPQRGKEVNKGKNKVDNHRALMRDPPLSIPTQKVAASKPKAREVSQAHEKHANHIVSNQQLDKNQPTMMSFSAVRPSTIIKRWKNHLGAETKWRCF